MGNCKGRGKAINPGSALDIVISQASSDDCVLYKLADYKKGGRLIEEYLRGGGREVERLITEEFGVFTYNSGKGMQITRTEYLKWKYRNVTKEQMIVQTNSKSPFDPLKKWQDHEACFQMAFRGSLGESLLHVLIMCNTKSHTRVAKILLKCFPKMALDVVEGEEYLGASALHLAIAYSNNELVNILVSCGANINQRAIGSFFLPRDQQVMKPPGPDFTDYEGLAYLGEYPLAWAACLGNETVYNRLLDHGASPNLQDNFGNMILHMVVICNQLGMFGYALRHPKLPAQDGLMNAAGLTPLTLACKLARSTIFREMLELTCVEFWRYSNITCSAYPLNALDTIRPTGETNWNSALMIILNGTKSEHLDMLEGGIIQRLLEEKWKTFARNQFLKRLGIMLLHLITLSVMLYLRPFYGIDDITKLTMDDKKALWNEFFDNDGSSIVRYCFEVIVLLEVLYYVIMQQGGEIMNQGFNSFAKGLVGNPPKGIFLISNLLLLMCLPLRASYFFSVDLDPQPRLIEDELIAYAAAGSWFMMLFFAGALKLTGPFVVMIYKMISGDMFTFSIIYGIMLLGFTQAFFFLYKRTPVPDKESKFYSYRTTWMALLHMTLGEYDYAGMNKNIYSGMTKFVFLVFTIMLPIMLLNMLIAMMGNTYSTVISMSEKEWVKAWAKIVIALERAVSQEKLKEYLYVYSVPLGETPDGEENLGVMIIKSANKTKAKQRKGAMSNWKRVGRVTIDALKRRGVTGEFLRKEMWGLHTEPSTPLHGPRKKGGAGAYNVKAGVATDGLALDIDELNDETDFTFNPDDHDGMGALTGALDQLAFATDLNLPGNVTAADDDQTKGRRPELASAEAANKRLQASQKEEEERRARKRAKELDNMAFIHDEDLFLAAGITQNYNEDSDENESVTYNVKKTPRVVVQHDHYLDANKLRDTKGYLPPLVDKNHHSSAVKLRRLGSGKRRTPRYGMVFTEVPQSRPSPRNTDQTNGIIPSRGSSIGYVNEKKDVHEHLKNRDAKENGQDNSSTPETYGASVAKDVNKIKTSVHDKQKKQKEDIEKTIRFAQSNQEAGESASSGHEPKPGRKKNKVGPASSQSIEEDLHQHQSLDESSSSSISGQSSETALLKDSPPKVIAPFTDKTPQQRMKNRSTDTITDMTSILPWDNDEGDII